MTLTPRRSHAETGEMDVAESGSTLRVQFSTPSTAASGEAVVGVIFVWDRNSGPWPVRLGDPQEESATDAQQ